MRQLVIALSLIITSSCGPKSANNKLSLKKSSIMNGTVVKDSDKIAASIVGVYNVKERYLCTGSLISNNIVLTAAHCAPEKATDIKIVFSTDIDDTMNTREPDILQEFVLSATDFKVGSTWNPNDETTEIDTGDIALIKFRGTIPSGFKVATFLPNQNILKNRAMVTVAGFGVDTVKTKRIDEKKYNDLEKAIEDGEVFCDENNGKYTNCYEIVSSGDGILRTTEAPISGIFKTEVFLDERKAGTCNGDSGGPAYIKQNGEFFLFGVTSRGSALCNESGVYTNALYYRQWINETIKILK